MTLRSLVVSFALALGLAFSGAPAQAGTNSPAKTSTPWTYRPKTHTRTSTKKTEPVTGDTTKKGTHVAAYTRRPAGTAFTPPQSTHRPVKGSK
jgi:hypothetical protein